MTSGRIFTNRMVYVQGDLNIASDYRTLNDRLNEGESSFAEETAHDRLYYLATAPQ